MKSHRTALIVDTTKGYSGKFQERVNRLLNSVNGPNIKVDVYTKQSSARETITPGAPSQTASSSPAATTDPQSFAKGLGYDLVLVATPGN